MQLRVKEIRKANKRKKERFKSLHKQEATAAPAPRGAAKPAGGAAPRAPKAPRAQAPAG